VAAQYAAARWGRDSSAAEILTKAAVAGAEAPGVLAQTADSELHEDFARVTAFDRLDPRRLVEANVGMTVSAHAATAAFVAESKAIQAGPLSLSRVSLSPKKVAGLTVVSKDVLKYGGPRALEVVRRDLARAAAIAVDTAFLGSAAAGAADAGLGYNITPITSSSTMADDLAAALSVFTGDIRTANWITTARVVARLAAEGYDSVGLRSGELLGLPILVGAGGLTPDTDGDNLLLVDGAAVMCCDEGIELSVSEHGMIEQQTDPTGATDTPVGATATYLTSMFGSDSAACRVIRHLGWSAAAGSVVIVSGIL
jgi:hypothetical protein